MDTFIRPAASALGHLYSTMLVKLQSIWPKGPFGNGFTLSFKNIVIMFYCKEQPIGWDFVEEFSRRLLALTQEGGTGHSGCYSLMLSHTESGLMVEVRLRLGYIG